MRRSCVRKLGFSLVELVIVVVIIGVIAGIAVPRISRGGKAAAESAIRADLRVFRSVIDQYSAEHGGSYPAAKSDGTNPSGTFKSFRSQLLLYTNEDGQASSVRDPSDFPFGPYLRSIPSGPLGPAKGDSRVKVKAAGNPLSGKATPGRAWRYDTITGQIIFNYNGISSDGVTPYDQF